MTTNLKKKKKKKDEEKDEQEKIQENNDHPQQEETIENNEHPKDQEEMNIKLEEENNNSENYEENEKEDQRNEESNEEKEEHSNEEEPIQIRSNKIQLNEDEDSRNEDENNEQEEIQENGNNFKIKENKTTENYNFDGINVSAFYFEDKDNMNIIFHKDASTPKLILHWGIYKNYPIQQWYLPRKENYPRNSKEFEGSALDTEFVEEGNESIIQLEIPKKDAQGISFVFHNLNNNAWYNNNWKDYQIKFVH